MYNINYHNVVKSHAYPAVVKLLAREFIEGATYFSVGKWLEQLSQFDLDLLMGLAETMEDDPEAGQVVVLLSGLLTQGEGLDFTEDFAPTRVGILITILSCESLYRKNLIEFDRTAVSFGEDELNNVIAWNKGEKKPCHTKAPLTPPKRSTEEDDQ